MYEEGLKLSDKKSGNGKDNPVSPATITRGPDTNGKPRPVVCCVDAYYKDYTSYIVVYGKPNKMSQIEQNAEIAIALSSETFTAMGVGRSLGWALGP